MFVPIVLRILALMTSVTQYKRIQRISSLSFSNPFGTSRRFEISNQKVNMGLKYTANLPRNLYNGTFKLLGNVANFLIRWSFIPFSLFSGHKIVSVINLLMLFRNKCIMECITNCFAIVYIHNIIIVVILFLKYVIFNTFCFEILLTLNKRHLKFVVVIKYIK